MSQAGPLGERVWVIAHRGASWDAPEHTLAAYDRAVEDGADFLEADLWQACDGSLVSIHDPTVDRTSNGTGAVADLTAGELRQLDFGSWFNRSYPDRARGEYAGASAVLFEEMLRRYREVDPPLRFHVETKHLYRSGEEAGAIDPAMEQELVRVLRDLDLVGPRVVVQSFWPRSLEVVADLTGRLVPTALLSLGPGPERLPAGVDVAAPNHLALLADLGYVARMHERGKEVHTWTVDDPDVMRALVRAGVDGIFTNRVAVLRRLLEEEFPEWTGPRPGRPAIRPSP